MLVPVVQGEGPLNAAVPRQRWKNMEYGLFISENRELPADPRLVCSVEWRYLLPPGRLRAVYFGSEFCNDLLPDAAKVIRHCARAREAGIEAVLLTPIATPDGLAEIEQLLCEVTQAQEAPAVVFNEWGVANLLRESFPHLQRRSGRHMNRGLRDPRLLEKSAVDEAVLGSRGRRLRSLLVRLGVTAVESDCDLGGGFLGDGTEGLQRVLYLPYAFAASSRNCLIKADGASTSAECFTKGLATPCSGLCRGRLHRIERADTALPLWRAGNTIFYEVPQSRAKVHIAEADRIVLHERPTP